MDSENIYTKNAQLIDNRLAGLLKSAKRKS